MAKKPESFSGEPYPVDPHMVEELKQKEAAKGKEGVDEVIDRLYAEADGEHSRQKEND